MVAETGSLGRAASKQNLAQPALSRQVRLLEEELGLRLFDRHGRGMVATEQGLVIIDHARRVLSAVDDLESAARQSTSELTGRVVIGLPPTLADVATVPLITSFAKHPKVQLRIVSAYSGYLLDWLQTGEVDVAVLFDPSASRSVRVQPFAEETLCLIGRPSLTSELRDVSFTELAHYPLILASSRHGLRTLVDRCARIAGVELQIRYEVDSYAALKDLVKAGFGWTILPSKAVLEETSSDRLTALKIFDPTPIRSLALAFKSDRLPSNAAEAVGKEIITILKQQII